MVRLTAFSQFFYSFPLKKSLQLFAQPPSPKANAANNRTRFDHLVSFPTFSIIFIISRFDCGADAGTHRDHCLRTSQGTAGRDFQVYRWEWLKRSQSHNDIFIPNNNACLLIIPNKADLVSEAGIRNYSSGGGVKAPATDATNVQGSRPSDPGPSSRVVEENLQSDPILAGSASKRQLKHPLEPGQDWEVLGHPLTHSDATFLL